MSQYPPSQLQTPSASSRRNARRQTLGVMPHGGVSSIPAPSPSVSKRTSIGGAGGEGGVARNVTNRRKSLAVPPDTASKPPAATRRSTRQSMIPRVSAGGRENLVPASPGGRSMQSQYSNNNNHGATTTNTNRRQSIGSVVTTRGRKSIAVPSRAARDLQEVNNGQFQEQCARRVLEYVKRHGYEHPITLKTIRSPSKKDFTLLVTFLMRQMDPMFQHPTGVAMKIEDEISVFFRAMGYPYAISKSSIASAGANIGWGSFLAALAWLVDQLTLLDGHMAPLEPTSFLDKVAPNPDGYETVMHAVQEGRFLYYDFVLDWYGAYMVDDGDEIGELKRLAHERLDWETKEVHEHKNKLKHDMQRFEELIVECLQAGEHLAGAKAVHSDLQKDLEQLKDLMSKLAQSISVSENKIKKGEAKKKDYHDEMVRVETMIAELKRTIDTQDMSVEDLKYLQLEHKGIKESAERCRETLKASKSTLRTAEIEFAQQLTKLDEKAAEYNAKLDALAKAMQSYEWNRFKATVDHDKARDENSDVKALVGVDFKGEVVPAMHEQDEALNNAIYIKRQEHTETEEEAAKLDKAIKEMHKELASSTDKSLSIQKQIEQQKAANDQAYAALDGDAKALEKEIAKFPDKAELENQLQAHNRKCAALEQELAQARHAGAMAIQSIHNQIQQALCIMKDHDAFVEAELQNLENYWKERTAGLEKDVLKKP